MTEQRKEILNYFRILKNKDFLGTSYLFIGQDYSIVFDIIKLINCSESSESCNQCWDCRGIEQRTHPDLFVVEPDGLTTKIEAIREAIRFFSLKSFSFGNKALVITKAQSLSPAASNAFLKTLEEPPKNSFIAICTTKLEGVLPTIVSRCRKIFLPAKFSQISESSYDLAQQFLDGEDIIFKDRKEFSLFLQALVVLLRDGLLTKANYPSNQLTSIDKGQMLARNYTLEQMQSILKNTLKVYGVYKNVNMNLALNLIKMRMG